MAVNRRAADWLRAVRLEPDPSCLFCLALVLWAVDRGELDAEGPVLQTLRAMSTWHPQRIMNFLDLLEGRDYEPDGWEAAQTARELAAVVLNDMEQRMFSHFPWYGSLE